MTRNGSPSPRNSETSPSVPSGRSEPWQEARRLADIVHGRLVEAGKTVGVAESLTGGLISSLLTESPGTSVTFRGALVVYASDLKHSLAGVSSRDLEEFGPVHAAIAAQLAAGARRRLEADYGVGATGVAGPGEQGGGKIGEVFISVASYEGDSTMRYEFKGTRNEVRITTVIQALSDLVDAIENAGTVANPGIANQ